MKTITKSFTYIDFLASPYRISYDLETKKKTCFSGCLSILIIASALLFTFLVGQELIFREEPNVSVSQVEIVQPQVDLYTNPIAFSINSLVDLEYLNLNEEFMRNVKLNAVEYSLVYLDEKVVPRYRGLILESCKEEMMESSVWEEGFTKMNPELVLCINPFKKIDEKGQLIEEPVVFTNPYGQNNSVSLTLQLTVCIDESESCKKTKEILDKKAILSVASLRYFINNQNFNNPANSVVRTGSIPLSLGTTNFANFAYEITRLQDDTGMLFKSESSRDFVNFREHQVFYELREDSQPTIALLTVGVEDIIDIVERRYMKLSEFLAQLGGFLKALIIVGRLFARISSKYAFYKFLLSERRTSHHERMMTERELCSKEPDQKERKMKEIGLAEFVWGMMFPQAARKNGTDRRTLYSCFDVKILELRLRKIETELLFKEAEPKSFEEKPSKE